MKYLLSVLLSAFLFVACNSSNSSNSDKTDSGASIAESTDVIDEPEVWHVDFANQITNKKDLFLSDIADSLSYILMETTNDYLIGEKGLSVKPCDAYIFIGQHDRPVGVFDRDGKFIRTIGRIGKGPEEFNNDYLFYPEEKGQKIIFANASRKCLTVYSWEGEFIKDIFPEIKPFFFAPVGVDNYLIWTGIQAQDSIGFYRLAFVNGNGEIVKTVYEDEREYGSGKQIMFMSPLVTPAKEGLLYNSWEEDLIYRILPDTIMRPTIEWDLGKYKMPFNVIDDYDRYNREKHKFVRDINAVEGKNKWYLRYYHTRGLEMAVFDKESNELLTVKNPDLEQNGLFNDLDGGPSFWPFYDTEQGGISYKMIPAIEILSSHSENLNYQGSPKDPEAAKQYQSLIKDLKPTDNPILIKVILK